MSVEWYYAVDQKQHGPISAKDLKRLAGINQVRPKDLVWKTGLKEWVTAENVKGLFEVDTLHNQEARNPEKGPQPLPLAHHYKSISKVVDAYPRPTSPENGNANERFEKIVEKAVTSQEKCQNCNSLQTNFESKCKNCGRIFDNVKFSKNTKIYWDTFIQQNSTYYFNQFNKFKIDGKKLFKPSWNWSAAFFTYSWLLYRKLYWWAIADLVLYLPIFFASTTFLGPNGPVIFIIGERILIGCVGNYLYFCKVEKEIENALNSIPTRLKSEISTHLKKRGSYNIWAPILVLLVLKMIWM